MHAIPAGPFRMGTPASDEMRTFDERALATVQVRAFCIDVYEYPGKRGVPPATAVGWADAKRLCEQRGRRLCSEAEWEKSCKGPGSTRWPYGSGFDAAACNTEDEGGDPRALAPSGQFERCRSGYGVMDLSGNVGEWTAEKLVKGGSWASSDYAVRCSARKQGGGGSKNSEVGFRCCADL
jgi:formylglycine-generating enzyme required for sulfatase activity